MQLSNVVPKIFSVFILSTFIGNLAAAEKVLCLVTSDIDKEVGKMVYEMDEVNRVITHLYKERWVDNKLIDRVELSVKELNGDGIVLNKKDKYVTVRLYSHNFDESSGGILYLDTLYNGVNGQRKEYTIEVRMDGGVDPVMTYNKTPFNRMHFIPKKSGIFGVVGIEKVNFLK